MTMNYLITYDIVGILIAIKVFPHTYHVTPLVTCDWASSPATLRIGAHHRTLNFGRLLSQYFISGQRQNVITFSQKQGIIRRIRSAENSKPTQRLLTFEGNTQAIKAHRRFSLAPSHLGKKERPSLLEERFCCVIFKTYELLTSGCAYWDIHRRGK